MKSVYPWILIALTAAIAGAPGCKEANVTGPGRRPDGSGTYIVNEGGFGGGGSLSFFDHSTGSVSHDVVRSGVPWLFPNDILFHGGMMYVAVNGNDVVSVVDPMSDSVVADVSFPPGAGPGLLASQGDWIYAANYDGTVSRIDPAGDSLAATSVPVVGFPGAILATSGRIFVSDLGSWPDTGANVIALDASTLAVVGSVTPGGGMAGMVAARGKIYVGASVTGKIFRFDPFSLQIEDSVELHVSPGDLATDGSSLFFLTADAVGRIPLSTLVPDTVPLIRRTVGLYHYALGVDATSGEIFVSTIMTGGGTGKVGVYTPAGGVVADPFDAGIFPGAFGFYRPAAP